MTPEAIIAAYDALLERAAKVTGRLYYPEDLLRLRIEGETAYLQYWQDEGTDSEQFLAEFLFLPEADFAEWFRVETARRAARQAVWDAERAEWRRRWLASLAEKEDKP